MNAKRWERVQQLFSEAIDLSPSEREKYLEEQTHNDQKLKDEVNKLLKSSDRADSFFGNLEENVASAWQQAAETTLLSEGEKVGSYQIIKEIGRGGMAVVYLAKRIDGEFERQVAIKVIKRGMDSEEVLKRFASEKQILASLAHPNVSNIIGSGLAPNGLPYFVMEYADGLPLIEYCNQNRLSIKDRLQIFVKVARTVQHAHQNLVIHRDLKPSNILVDKEGNLKLLDFGIAKVLDEDNDLRTKTAMRLLTPEYASPEQLSGKNITTSSDIYQLGLLLFELLTDARPFNFDKGESVLEWQSRLINTNTPSPSKIFSELSDKEAKQIANARQTEPNNLQKILKSELQYIVLMCLRNETERRYQTAEQVAEDIERYLENRPLLARPNSWAYKTRKAFARNKLAWTAFALLFLALVGGVITTTWQAQKANKEKLRAEQTLALVTDLFRSPDPRIAEAEGRDVKVSDFLKASEEKILDNLETQPEIQTQLLTILSDLYDNLDLADEGTQLEEKLLPVYVDQFGENSPQTAESIRKLSRWAFEAKGDVALADSLFGESFDIFSKTFGKQSKEYATLLTDYGLFVQTGKGKILEADSIFKVSQEIFISVDTLNSDYASTLSMRGLIANNLGQLEKALAFYERELFIRQKINQDEVGIAITKGNIASIFIKRQELMRAEVIAKEALKALEKRLGDSHKHTLTNLSNLGVIYANRGDIERGKPIALRAYNGFLEKYGEKNDKLAATGLNVAFFYIKEGNYDSALYYCNRSEEIFTSIFGESHYIAALPLLARVEIWIQKGEAQKALADAKKAEMLLPTPPIPPVHYYKGLLNLRLGTAYQATGNKPLAKKHLDKAVNILIQTNGKEHYSTKAAEKALAKLGN